MAQPNAFYMLKETIKRPKCIFPNYCTFYTLEGGFFLNIKITKVFRNHMQTKITVRTTLFLFSGNLWCRIPLRFNVINPSVL